MSKRRFRLTTVGKVPVGTWFWRVQSKSFSSRIRRAVEGQVWKHMGNETVINIGGRGFPFKKMSARSNLEVWVEVE